MLSMKVLIRFVDREFLVKLLLLLLFYSLLPIGEIVLLFFIKDYLGSYITLASVAGTGLIGLIFAWSRISAIMKALRIRIRSGYFPREEFVSLAGCCVGSILLLTPGFITDIAGFFLFFSLFRRIAGTQIVRRMEGRLKELYEYLKLYEV